MKKLYSLIVMIAAIVLFSNKANSQQTTENFESWTTGSSIASQAPEMWTTWSGAVGNSEDPIVTEAESHNGTKSLSIVTDNDGVLKLNDLTTGRYSIEFYIYVPTGKMAYYNILQDFNGTNSIWGMQIYLKNNQITIYGSTSEASYTPDTWIKMKHIIDLDSDWAEIYHDDILLHTCKWSNGSVNDGTGINKLDAMNFYGASETNLPGLYYIDDIIIEQVTAPDSPSNLAIEIANDFDINLTWTAPENTENMQDYAITRDGLTIARTTETSYTDSHVYPGTYEYGVRAFYSSEWGHSAATSATAEIQGAIERHNVLVEVFSATTCVYCPFVVKALDQLESTANLDLIVIDHQTGGNFANITSNSRFSYWAGMENYYNQSYDFTGTPSFVFDGYLGIGGTPSTNVDEVKTYCTTYYNFVKDINSTHDLNCTLTQDDEINERNFQIEINVDEISAYYGDDDIRVQVALTEDVTYTWQGYSKLNNMLRNMYPNVNGTAVVFDENSQFSTTIEVSIPESYDMQKCKLVVFVENHDAGRVLQSQLFKISDYSETNIEENKIASNIYPNPSNGIFDIESQNNIENIEVYDITGKLIMQNNVNSNKTNLDLTTYSKGIYTLKAYSKEGVEITKLIVE